jgi:hypothetical protein
VNFLLSNALFWLDRYHVDGLRVDAVASMLYLDYSREANDWVPNEFGGRENLAAVSFLKRLNELAFGEFPGSTTMAEESTAWPAVSRPVYVGGLGFGYKWNMGWMHDTLSYMAHEPIYRRYHQHELTFGLLYAFSENFVLPLPRRGGARQGLAARQDAGRPLAEVRQPARLSVLHVDPSGQEAPVHGRRVRPGGRVEPQPEPRLAPARRLDASRHAVAGARPQPALPRNPGAAREGLRAAGLRVGRRQRHRELGPVVPAPRHRRPTGLA